MTREERNGLVWVIVALLVAILFAEVASWLAPQPYRWTRDESIETSVIELDGRHYLLIDSGELVDIEEEYAESLRSE